MTQQFFVGFSGSHGAFALPQHLVWELPTSPLGQLTFPLTDTVYERCRGEINLIAFSTSVISDPLPEVVINTPALLTVNCQGVF